MFKLEFGLSNAAMRYPQDDEEQPTSPDLSAIAEVLKGVVSSVKNEERSGILWDANGNKIGSWEYTDE